MYRCKRGLSQSELARRVEINPSGLSRIEAGKEALSKAVSERICQVLDISPDRLKPSYHAAEEDKKETAAANGK